jgi:ATP-dependent Clp protease ATP-binding subunit ClpC
MLQKIAKNLRERNIPLVVTDKAKAYLIDKGYDPEYGARPLRRVLQQYVEDAIAEALLSGTLKDNRPATVDFKDGEIIIR